MKYKNYYEILDVTRKSSMQEIKLSYRKLAKLYHPDTGIWQLIKYKIDVSIESA